MFKFRKRIFILFVVFAIALGSGNAQNFGLKWHFNFAKNSWVNPDATFSFQEHYASKYAIGPFIELRLIPFFSLSAEGLLAKKGGIISPPSKKGIEYRLTYVSLPLLFNVFIIPIGPVQIFISAGFEYSYLLAGKTYDLDNEDESENDIKDRLSSSDTAYLMGGGLRFNLIVTSVILEGRYSIGQKNIFLPEYRAEDESFKNRVFSFGIGFTF
jgi:opacity protein-like surface antigen